jgi:hypothetical protein
MFPLLSIRLLSFPMAPQPAFTLDTSLTIARRSLLLVPWFGSRRDGRNAYRSTERESRSNCSSVRLSGM